MELQDYTVVDPSGRERVIQGPKGASDAEVIAQAQKLFMTPKRPLITPAFEKEAAQISAPATNPNATKLGVGEAALTAGTSMLGSVLGGLSGIGVNATNAAGLTDTAPADAVKQVQGMLTYQPRTEAGKKAVGILAYPGEKIGQLADYLGGKATDATGSPLLGTASNVATQAIPALLGQGASTALRARGVRIDAANATAQEANAVRDATHRAALDAGYTFPPSQTNGGMLNNTLESIGGKTALKQEATRRNQVVTTRLAAEELPGYNSREPLTPGNLDRYRAQQSAPYQEVASLPTMPAPQRYGQLGQPLHTPPNQSPAAALHDLKVARENASANWTSFDRQGGTEARDAARRFDAEAARLEAYLDQTAQAAGRPDLVQQMRVARQNIAKSHDVERALNLGDANVEAPVIGRALDRNAPLTGGLLTIGRTQQAQAFKPYMGAGATTPGVSALEPLLMGEGMAAAATGHPAAGAVGMGLPLLRGPARSFLLSPAHQQAMLPNYQRGLLSQSLPGGIDALVAAELASQAQRKK